MMQAVFARKTAIAAREAREKREARTPQQREAERRDWENGRALGEIAEQLRRVELAVAAAAQREAMTVDVDIDDHLEYKDFVAQRVADELRRNGYKVITRRYYPPHTSLYIGWADDMDSPQSGKMQEGEGRAAGAAVAEAGV